MAYIVLYVAIVALAIGHCITVYYAKRNKIKMLEYHSWTINHFKTEQEIDKHILDVLKDMSAEIKEIKERGK